jgi:hypothetical protein
MITASTTAELVELQLTVMDNWGEEYSTQSVVLRIDREPPQVMMI